MYTTPVDWSTAIHGRSKGFTPIPIPCPGAVEGLIPRLSIPCSSRSLKTLLLGAKVRPPSVDRDTSIAPWGTLKKKGGPPPSTTLARTPPAYIAPSGALAAIPSPTPFVFRVNPVAPLKPAAINKGFGPSEKLIAAQGV